MHAPVEANKRYGRLQTAQEVLVAQMAQLLTQDEGVALDTHILLISRKPTAQLLQLVEAPKQDKQDTWQF